jgi:hypothetical protein
VLDTVDGKEEGDLKAPPDIITSIEARKTGSFLITISFLIKE